MQGQPRRVCRGGVRRTPKRANLKKKNREERRGKSNKIRKIDQNYHNSVSKWVKSGAFSRGQSFSPLILSKSAPPQNINLAIRPWAYHSIQKVQQLKLTCADTQVLIIYTGLDKVISKMRRHHCHCSITAWIETLYVNVYKKSEYQLLILDRFQAHTHVQMYETTTRDLIISCNHCLSPYLNDFHTLL